MNIKIYHVDAFTDKAFSGNPAAVCILEKGKIDKWMQELASEINLPETAFVLKEGDHYNLRWFTPKVEVDLCGHATLASAHILWEVGVVEGHAEILFSTNSGDLRIHKKGSWIEMDFPSEPEMETDPPKYLLESLGVEPLYIGKNRFDYLIEVKGESILENIDPDFNILSKVDTRGVIVTCRSDSKKYDFCSRFFAPSVGINEDPVTGSAHCCLALYWNKKMGKDEFSARQASSRGGEIRINLRNDRVILAGQAITVFEAVLKL